MCIYCLEKYSNYAIRYARSESKTDSPDSAEAKEFSRQMLNYESDPSYDPDCMDKQGVFTKDFDSLEQLNYDQVDPAEEFEEYVKGLDEQLKGSFSIDGRLFDKTPDKDTNCRVDAKPHTYINYTGLGARAPGETICSKCGVPK